MSGEKGGKNYIDPDIPSGNFSLVQAQAGDERMARLLGKDWDCQGMTVPCKHQMSPGPRTGWLNLLALETSGMIQLLRNNIIMYFP